MSRRKIRKSPQRNVPNEDGVVFFGDFRPICRHISKTVHFRHMQNPKLAMIGLSIRPSVCLSVRLSVRHTLALSQNDAS